MAEEELPRWGKLVAGQRSTDSSKKHYCSFILDHEEYFLYDFVFLKSEEEEPYIAMILDLWDDGNSMEMRIRWMWRPSDLPLDIDIDIDRSDSNKELFLATGPGTGVEDDNDVCTVIGKCTNIFCSLTEMDQQSLQTCSQEADFFFYRAYNHEKRKIYASLDEVVGELGVNKICSSVAKVLPTQDACIIMNRQQKNVCGATSSLLPKTGENELACKEMVRTTPEKLVKQTGVPRKRTRDDDVCKIKKRVKFSFTNTSADVETHNEIGAIQFGRPKLDYDRSDTKSRNLGSVRCPQVSNHETSTSNYSGKETIPPENSNCKSKDETNPEVEMLDVDVVSKGNVMEANSDNVAVDKVVGLEREVKFNDVNVAPYELVNCRLGISKLNGLQTDVKKGQKKLNLRLQVDVNTRDTMFIGSHPSVRIGVNLDEAPSSKLLASKVKMSMPMVLKKGTHEPLLSMVDNLIKPVKESCPSALVDAPKGKKRELFKQMTWEETLEEGFLTGKVLLFQNLDPCWTSEDIKDAIHAIFPKVVCRVSSVAQRCSLHCSQQQSGDSILALGQALIVFKERHTGDKILNIFQQRCLVLSNDGRPCLVTPVERPLTKSARFPGHLDLEKYKCSRAYQAKVKIALSTAHCAQQNTAEFEMASRWRMLSEQHSIQWKGLLKMQELEMQQLTGIK